MCHACVGAWLILLAKSLGMTSDSTLRASGLDRPHRPQPQDTKTLASAQENIPTGTLIVYQKPFTTSSTIFYRLLKLLFLSSGSLFQSRLRACVPVCVIRIVLRWFCVRSPDFGLIGAA